MTEPHDHRDLDAVLRSLDDPQPSARLLRAIAEVPARHPHPEAASGWWPFARLWHGIAAGVLLCSLGALAGSTLESERTSDELASGQTNVTLDDTWSEGGVDLAFAWSLDEETQP